MIHRILQRTIGVFAIGIALLCLLARADEPSSKLDDSHVYKAGEFTMTGPYVYKNLTIFRIHGPDQSPGKRYITLQDAIQKKTAIVHETSSANELGVENLSTDVDVFIQAGEIVKGGLQDRTIGMDYLVPPRRGYLPLKVFCVDLGRWEARPRESGDKFDSASTCVAGSLLKMAVQKAANQDQVWWAVKLMQRKLAAGVGHSVVDPHWANSYELAIENSTVRQTMLDYSDHLSSIIDEKSDQGNVIGCVIAINGKLSSADIYASHDVFARLWPKLLNSAAIEALAEMPKDKKFEPAGFDLVKTAIEGVDRARAATRDGNTRMVLLTRETKEAIIFESHDRWDPRFATPHNWVHRSYLMKQGYTPVASHDAGQKEIIVPH